eukprot:scaffold301457_cov17-Tisochrysis_lutea.AAC.1
MELLIVWAFYTDAHPSLAKVKKMNESNALCINAHPQSSHTLRDSHQRKLASALDYDTIFSAY